MHRWSPLPPMSRQTARRLAREGRCGQLRPDLADMVSFGNSVGFLLSGNCSCHHAVAALSCSGGRTLQVRRLRHVRYDSATCSLQIHAVLTI
jgi:hypothetical protein